MAGTSSLNHAWLVFDEPRFEDDTYKVAPVLIERLRNIFSLMYEQSPEPPFVVRLRRDHVQFDSYFKLRKTNQFKKDNVDLAANYAPRTKDLEEDVKRSWDEACLTLYAALYDVAPALYACSYNQGRPIYVSEAGVELYSWLQTVTQWPDLAESKRAQAHAFESVLKTTLRAAQRGLFYLDAKVANMVMVWKGDPRKRQLAAQVFKYDESMGSTAYKNPLIELNELDYKKFEVKLIDYDPVYTTLLGVDDAEMPPARDLAYSGFVDPMCMTDLTLCILIVTSTYIAGPRYGTFLRMLTRYVDQRINGDAIFEREYYRPPTLCEAAGSQELAGTGEMDLTAALTPYELVESVLYIMRAYAEGLDGFDSNRRDMYTVKGIAKWATAEIGRKTAEGLSA